MHTHIHKPACTHTHTLTPQVHSHTHTHLPRLLPHTHTCSASGAGPRTLTGCGPQESRGCGPQDSVIRGSRPQDSVIRGCGPQDSVIRGCGPQDSVIQGCDSGLWGWRMQSAHKAAVSNERRRFHLGGAWLQGGGSPALASLEHRPWARRDSSANPAAREPCWPIAAHAHASSLNTHTHTTRTHALSTRTQRAHTTRTQHAHTLSTRTQRTHALSTRTQHAHTLTQHAHNAHTRSLNTHTHTRSHNTRTRSLASLPASRRAPAWPQFRNVGFQKPLRLQPGKRRETVAEPLWIFLRTTGPCRLFSCKRLFLKSQALS